MIFFASTFCQEYNKDVVIGTMSNTCLLTLDAFALHRIVIRMYDHKHHIVYKLKTLMSKPFKSKWFKVPFPIKEIRCG